MTIRIAESSALLSQAAAKTLSTNPLKKAISKSMQDIWRDGAKVFAEVLARKILVETGESGGSLRPLAREVGAVLKFRKPFNAKVIRPSLNLSGDIIGPQRSPETGEAKGREAFKFTFTENKFFFEFRIPVFQFFLHDTGRAKFVDFSAVDATNDAREAMEDFVRKAYRERIGGLIGDWIVTGKVRTVR